MKALFCLQPVQDMCELDDYKSPQHISKLLEWVTGVLW